MQLSISYVANKYEYVKKSIDKRRSWLADLKQGNPCADCGIIYPHYIMDWHHLDKDTKEFGIGQGSFRHGKAKILAEIQKCVLLCSNCHREREYAQDVQITPIEGYE